MPLRRFIIVTALVVSLALVFPLLCLAEGDHSNLISKFVGTWNENQAKRQIGTFGSLRFRRAADGSLEELRGPEAKPVVQPVNFGVKPYTVDADTMISWKQIDATHFERQLFGSGKLVTTREISISGDGRKLTEATHSQTRDGKAATDTITYVRTSGDSKDLVGIWKPESMVRSEGGQLKIEAIGTGGLHITRRNGMVVTLMFDGKPNPTTGVAVISGMTASARVINDNTIEETARREGVVTGKTTWVLSPDGQTLTVTSRQEVSKGGNPFVVVFDKQ
jgi:hypothetical protein